MVINEFVIFIVLTMCLKQIGMEGGRKERRLVPWQAYNIDASKQCVYTGITWLCIDIKGGLHVEHIIIHFLQFSSHLSPIFGIPAQFMILFHMATKYTGSCTLARQVCCSISTYAGHECHESLCEKTNDRFGGGNTLSVCFTPNSWIVRAFAQETRGQDSRSPSLTRCLNLYLSKFTV